MKYIGKNLKSDDCAIVGAYNALIWLNIKANYRYLEKFAKKHCKYDSKAGFEAEYLECFMKYMGISFNSLENLTIRDAEKKILNGNAMLASITTDEYCHMIFLKPNKEHGIEILNSEMTWMDLVDKFLKKEIKLSMWSVSE